MKAIVYTEYGPPEVLRLAEIEKPEPKDNEVRIRVHATTASSSDSNVRGFVFVPPGFKFMSRLMFGLRGPRKQVPGIEVSGVVDAVGRDVTRFTVGDAVFGLTGMRLGAYAEYVCVPEGAGLVTKPEHITFEEAAAIPNGALTALTFLKNRANVQPGQTVLVIGASGSMGSAAVQIAKHYGAEVTGVCSTRNIELVQSLGASRVIDYTKEDALSSGETYDLIFDTVGSTSFGGCKHALKPGGMYLAGSGGPGPLFQALWTGLMGGKKVKAGPSSERHEDLSVVKALVEAGAIKPVIDRCYPMEEIVEAHRYVDTGRKRGNVVIRVAAG